MNIEQIAQEDKILGTKIPSWTEEEGVKDGRLNVVGYAEMSANKSEHFIKKSALMDAEVKLLSDAPADFRIITQNALVGADIDSSEFYQIQTKLQEVFAVTGMKQGQSTCRKIVRYGETKVSLVRACWHQASASIIQLKKAYAHTLAIKYGQGKANKFEDLMQKELDKINNHRRYDNEVVNNNQVTNSGNHLADQQTSNSSRLSTSRLQEQDQSIQSNHSDRNGRDLSSSRDQSLQ